MVIPTQESRSIVMAKKKAKKAKASPRMGRPFKYDGRTPVRVNVSLDPLNYQKVKDAGAVLSDLVNDWLRTWKP